MTAVEKVDSEPDAYTKKVIIVSVVSAGVIILGGFVLLYYLVPNELLSRRPAAVGWTLACGVMITIISLTLGVLHKHEKKLK